MPKNFNTTTDAEVNAYLASLSTPNSLWLVLVNQNLASIDSGDAYSDLSGAPGLPSIQTTGLTCVNRVINMGGPHIWSGTTQQPRSIVVLTAAPTNPAALLYAAENLKESGEVYDFATEGPLAVDSFSLKMAWQGEP